MLDDFYGGGILRMHSIKIFMHIEIQLKHKLGFDDFPYTCIHISLHMVNIFLEIAG
jgi:hypothetical protein